MTTLHGSVKWYNSRKGYGFVQRDDGEKDVFVHASQVKQAGIKYLNENQKLTFELEDSQKGPNAINLKIIDK
jgi:CspA family cold shock protein